MSDTFRTSPGMESPTDFGRDREGVAVRWIAEITKAREDRDDWWQRCRAILDRYRDEGPTRRGIGQDVAIGMRMNLLWSNVQTLHPALYAAMPEPIVERRWGDQDDTSRVACLILQRAIRYQMEESDFDGTMKQCVLDNLLSGQGTIWIRYEPHFQRQPLVAGTSLSPPMVAAVHPNPIPPMPSGLPTPPNQIPQAPGPLPQPPPAPPAPIPVQSPPNPLPPAAMGGPGGMVPPGAPVPGPPGASPVGAPPGLGPPPPGAAPGVAPPPPVLPSPAQPVAPLPPPPPPPMPLAAGPIPIGTLFDQRPDAAKQRPQDGGLQIADDGEQDSEYIAWEECKIDHVNWEDWVCSPARTWQEVRWVARRAYMTKDEVRKRFGRRLADDIPYQWHPRELNDTDATVPENQLFSRAEIYEIWDKPSRRVYWLAWNYGEEILDWRDDPLRLPSFFPTPKPLYGTLTTDTVVPVPDYMLYRDQAVEIDNITARIHSIGKSIKVCGVYDASQDGIQRMFSEGVENQLIPVNQWMAFAESGGLKGAIDILDVGNLSEVLQRLVEIRTQAKQDLYEVTGISDIIRGTTAASETATAQQIKAGFGTMRLRARQGEVARFCRDIIRLVGDVICEHFTPRTLLAVADAQNIPPADTANVLPAIALLKDDKTRPLRLDIETDSTIMADQQQQQQSRIQFLTMAGQFLNQALPAVQQHPQLAPLLGQMMLFGIRAFPQGAELEGAFEQAVRDLQQTAQQGALAGPPPDPKMLLAEAQIRNIDSQIANRQIDNTRDNDEASMKLRLEGAKVGVAKQRADQEHDRAVAQMFHDHHQDDANLVLQGAKVGLQAGRGGGLP